MNQGINSYLDHPVSFCKKCENEKSRMCQKGGNSEPSYVVLVLLILKRRYIT